MEKKYLFISYSHRNSPAVFSIVRHMQKDGYLCWIDRRLQGGSRWSDELARRIDGCACFVLFISDSYLQSENCKDEWAYAKDRGRPVLPIRLDSTELPKDMKLGIGRIQSLFYDGTEDFWKRLYESVGVKECLYSPDDEDVLRLDLNGGKKKVDYEPVIGALVQWLTDISPRWGAMDTAQNAQHANTCEGLLAMKLSGYDVLRKSCFRRTWNALMRDVTPHGLSSKSLGRETVVCTSMVLLLAAMDRGNLTGEERALFDSIAVDLWQNRNPETGWGVFNAPTEEDYCSYANTAWAVRALMEYPSIRKDPAFLDFCHQLFESERDGKFSYFRGGRPTLIVTAMFLSIFYRMDRKWQDEQKKVFNLKAAVQFVYHSFVERNVQVEGETLYGIDTDGTGPKKVPWNHVVVWAALDALSQAYYTGDMDEERWQRLLVHMDRILEENLRRSGNKVWYHPENMEESRKGSFTFPTAYLIMGLSQMAQNDV